MTQTLRTKRFIKQIIPFGLIWMGFALVYSLLEYGLIGALDSYPASGNPYSFKHNIIPLLFGSFAVGLVQGTFEIRWFRRKLAGIPLWLKIILKNIFYIFFIAIALVIFSIVNSYSNYDDYLFTDALDDLDRFAGNFAFWSILIFMAFVTGIAIFFSELMLYVGDGVLYNSLFSTYHKPKTETRIFMFLDMKSSTTIAEKLGHAKYFPLLKQYYADMTRAILSTEAEIYQYVGDEIVLSWSKASGLRANNCIVCFLKIAENMKRKESYYLEQFGVAPSFKAGFHIGEVTIGEIGTIKRNIIYTGDILNTAARIEAECNNYESQALISGELHTVLNTSGKQLFKRIGKLMLRGKKVPIDLYTLSS